jgi:cation diffusion facilitator family transporter
MSSSGGSRAVVAALTANVGIAIIKFIAFLLTGATSMLAEAVHSLADSGNQGLLLIGGRRSRRQATAEHPFGFGRDRYVYGFLVALVLFSLGGLFALYEGIQKVLHPHHVDSPLIAVGVLVVAILLEGWSFRTAVRESAELKGDASWIQFIRRSKVPELPVVLLEDFAALIGLGLALLGVGLSSLFDHPVWDGIGTVGIGLLLVSVAIVLVVETKSLLLGESASPAAVARIEQALIGPGVDRVIHQRTMHLGPEEVLLAAKLAMSPTSSLRDIAEAIDAAEARVRAAEPTTRVIYLEPDIDRGVGS